MKTRAELLAAGRHPLLTSADVSAFGKSAQLVLSGAVRPTNTRFGARLYVEVEIEPPFGPRREFAVSFRSHSYVRLCELLGDDCTEWRGGTVQARIVTPADGRKRVEIV